MTLELDDCRQAEWRMDWEQNLLNVFNRDLGANKASNLLIRSFSLKTGAQLWSHVINNVIQTPKIITSERNWIVLGCNDGSKICALDTVQKSHKILSLPNQNGLNEVLDLAVQQGKAIGFGMNGTAIIWNLVSGEVLHRVKHSTPTLPKQGKILQFDPAKLQFTFWATKKVWGREVIRTWKMEPGGFSRINCADFFPPEPDVSGDLLIFDLFCRAGVSTWGGMRAWASLNSIDPDYVHDYNIDFKFNSGFGRKKLFLAPTFAAFESGGKICVNDFLNVAQFTKSEGASDD